jgi:hypothetical protein
MNSSLYSLPVRDENEGRGTEANEGAEEGTDDRKGKERKGKERKGRWEEIKE